MNKLTRIAAPFTVIAALGLGGCAADKDIPHTLGNWEMPKPGTVRDTMPVYTPPSRETGPSLLSHGPRLLEGQNKNAVMCTYTAGVFTRVYNVSTRLVAEIPPDPQNPDDTVMFTGYCNGYRVPVKIGRCVSAGGPIPERFHEFDRNGEPLKRRVVARRYNRLMRCPGENRPLFMEFGRNGPSSPPGSLLGIGLGGL